MASFSRILGQSWKSWISVILPNEILPFNFDLKFCWNWTFFHYEKIMRFKNGPQLPGAGRTRAGHHHGSHTPTSLGIILLGKMAYHTKQIRQLKNLIIQDESSLSLNDSSMLPLDIISSNLHTCLWRTRIQSAAF